MIVGEGGIKLIVDLELVYVIGGEVLERGFRGEGLLIWDLERGEISSSDWTTGRDLV